jgi:hypothetical protein
MTSEGLQSVQRSAVHSGCAQHRQVNKSFHAEDFNKAAEHVQQTMRIETSYRICNQFLIKTTSKQYVVRLFYYLFACAVYNAWVLYEG